MASHIAERLINNFDFIYTFNCKNLTIERFLQELSDFLSRNDVKSLKDYIKNDDPLTLKLINAVQVLSEINILVILE